MSAPDYLVTDLGEWDDLDSFTCGTPALDVWLHETARRAQKAGTVRVRLLRSCDAGQLVGYYAVCPTEVLREELALSSKVRAASSRVPGFMLAKLAISAEVQGRGLGRDLLVDALEHICEASDLVGGRIVVVDPVDDRAANFYARYGFSSIVGSTRMYLLVPDAKASLGLA
ncbi:GNAT family N-acetyltransferase [Cellulomonas palmilytica]|uniref:GNAT family N-acetyltransferase n=1 Tax=Cellulomonas palmilytica TaxID=2608402 RepID=UPI001F468A3A|nr:GNAT family N-acetyltransferase [Cellulomonas palmilytica]UJP40037.1 GNAT family N-acetyltransferase [Cellulomonas palmilytica]